MVTAAGFFASAHDSALFVHVSPRGRILLLLRYFRGIEISSMPEGFFFSQEKYIQDLLGRTSLTDHRTAETPIEGPEKVTRGGVNGSQSKFLIET
jgi:hypothetical protein